MSLTKHSLLRFGDTPKWRRKTIKKHLNLHAEKIKKCVKIWSKKLPKRTPKTIQNRLEFRSCFWHHFLIKKMAFLGPKGPKKDPKNDTKSIRISVLFLAPLFDQKKWFPCPKWAPRLRRRPAADLASDWRHPP